MNYSEIALVVSLSLLGMVGAVCLLFWVRQRENRSDYQRLHDDDPRN